MRIQDQKDVVDSHMPAQSGEPSHPRRLSRLAGVGTIVVVALVVVASVILFTTWRGQRPGTSTPAAGQWIHSLDGYSVSSLTAARSDPATLYACVSPFRSGGSSGAASGASSSTGSGSAASVPADSGGAASTGATIMRSTDYGAHWQDIGVNAGLHGTCMLAVDPSHSDHLYVIDAPASVSSGGNSASLLKFSTDAGRTWDTIAPQWDATIKNAKTPWTVQQLSMAGDKLYGLQWLQGQQDERGDQGGAIPDRIPVAHLVESSDGGHTWSVIKNTFSGPKGVQRFVVDPTNPDTIYAVVGTPFYEGTPALPQGKMPGGAYSLTRELYKTTDNGKTWTQLLKDLYYGADVQLASGKPSTVYAGGIIGPMPLGAQSAADTASYVQSGNEFKLRVSQDSGASWHDVPLPSKLYPTQFWFVDEHGRLFVAASSINGTGGQGTDVASTAVAPPATPAVPPGSGKAAPQIDASNASTDAAPPDQYAYAKVDQVSGTTQIQWYDPASGAWSNPLQAPIYGSLIAITPAGTANQTIVWLAEYSNNAQGLASFITA